MKMLKTLLSMATAAMLFINLAMAADFTVGGPNGGWDQSTDLTTWASSQKFSEGDNLIFQYTPSHDVAEVSKADFDSCTASNPLQRPFSGGSTTIPLTSAGKRYFICGSGGHCLGGMKVEIDILASSAPPPSTTHPPPPAPVIPPPSPPRATTPIPPPPRVTPPVLSPPPPTTIPSPPPTTTPSVPRSPPPTATPILAPSPPPTPSVRRPVSSPPLKSTTASSPSPTHSHAPTSKVSPSISPLSKAPTLSPADSALPPSDFLLPLPPAPSSGAKFSGMGALTASFLMMMFFNL